MCDLSLLQLLLGGSSGENAVEEGKDNCKSSADHYPLLHRGQVLHKGEDSGNSESIELSNLLLDLLRGAKCDQNKDHGNQDQTCVDTPTDIAHLRNDHVAVRRHRGIETGCGSTEAINVRIRDDNGILIDIPAVDQFNDLARITNSIGFCAVATAKGCRITCKDLLFHLGSTGQVKNAFTGVDHCIVGGGGKGACLDHQITAIQLQSCTFNTGDAARSALGGIGNGNGSTYGNEGGMCGDGMTVEVNGVCTVELESRGDQNIVIKDNGRTLYACRLVQGTKQRIGFRNGLISVHNGGNVAGSSRSDCKCGKKHANHAKS